MTRVPDAKQAAKLGLDSRVPADRLSDHAPAECAEYARLTEVELNMGFEGEGFAARHTPTRADWARATSRRRRRRFLHQLLKRFSIQAQSIT